MSVISKCVLVFCPSRNFNICAQTSHVFCEVDDFTASIEKRLVANLFCH